MENQNVDKYQGQLAKSIKGRDLPRICPWKGHLTNMKIRSFLIMNHITKSEQVKLIAMMVIMTTIGKEGKDQKN